jgi:V8-like Glu-specific endopeptidase
LEAVFSSAGIADRIQGNTLEDSDPDFVGREVYFNPPPVALDAAPENDYQSRIVGGYDSDQQRSYAMHLRYQSSDNSWHYAGCGGTLISSCHVLTAAHCVANGRAGLPDGVYINAYRPFEGNANAPFHFSEVSRVHVHPDFNDDGNINDVAVVTMKTCANTNTFPIMRVADLDFMTNVQNEDEVSVSGLGRLSSSNPDLVDQIQRVEVEFIDTNTCDDYYSGKIKEDMICAGVPNGGRDSCQGDSGGPLFMDQNDASQVQIGIVSWGSGCAVASKPGVYASVAYHFDFIATEVCNHASVDTSIELCDTFAPPPVPVPAPLPAPTMAPAATCGMFGSECYSSLDCCSQYQCQPRDGVCTHPSSAGSSNGKQSVNKRRRNGKY